MKKENTFPLPGGTSAIIFSFPTWGSSFIALLKRTCFPFTNSKVPWTWTWTWDFRSGTPRLLATCRRLEEKQKTEGNLSSQDRARLTAFVPHPPWKVGTRIIHLVSGDVGLRRAE